MKSYTISDGKIVLVLSEVRGGGFVVTTPLDPEMITEAETVGEAFVNARDALKSLRQARASLFRKLSRASG